MTPRQRALYDAAEEQRRRCRDWLLPYMILGKPRVFTKDELRAAAMRDLGASKNAFDFAWIDAIESMGRQDWYYPLPRRRRPEN